MRLKLKLALILISTSLLIYFFNREIFLVLNGDRGWLINWIMLYFTQLGDGYVAALICLFLWLKGRKRGVAGILAFIVSAIIAQTLKSCFHAPRPIKVFDGVFIIGEVLQQRSFPSGHSATIASVARILWDISGKKMRWGIAIVALLVGISRIYVGAHFPIDVAVGFAIGWLGAELTLKLTEWWKIQSCPPGSVLEKNIITGLIIVGSLGMIFIYQVQDAQWFYRVFGTICIATAFLNLIGRKTENR
jgi:membrane-associated phospholipid phosphatase